MIITKDYVFTFGKYKNANILDVCDSDAKYVLWCNDNIDWFNLNENTENYALNRDIPEYDEEYNHGLDELYGKDGW